MPEQESKIDPTVPLQGLPRESVVSAEWHEEEEVFQHQGLERKIPRRYPKINGYVLNEMTSPDTWRRVLKYFPSEPVLIPENDDERDRRLNKGKYRAAQSVIWNGLEFTMPKGVPVMVPGPIARMVDHINEAYRTREVQDRISELTEAGT